MFQSLCRHFESPLIDVLVVSPSVVSAEIERGGLTLQPLLALGFLIMIVFTVASTTLSAALTDQLEIYKVRDVFSAVDR